jgi:hypothetical protein
MRLTIRVIVAFITFGVGVASASLYVVSHYRPAKEVSFTLKETPSMPPVSAPQQPVHPEGWQRVNVGSKFFFYLPPDMRQVELPGNIDYFGPHQTFGGKDLEVHCGYVEKRSNDEHWRGKVSCETLSGGITSEPDYRREEIEIGGRRATQVVWRSDDSKFSFATLCFSDIGDGTLLKFGVASRKASALDLARQIFGSIEFPD